MTTRVGRPGGTTRGGPSPAGPNGGRATGLSLSWHPGSKSSNTFAIFLQIKKEYFECIMCTVFVGLAKYLNAANLLLLAVLKTTGTAKINKPFFFVFRMSVEL